MVRFIGPVHRSDLPGITFGMWNSGAAIGCRPVFSRRRAVSKTACAKECISDRAAAARCVPEDNMLIYSLPFQAVVTPTDLRMGIGYQHRCLLRRRPPTTFASWLVWLCLLLFPRRPPRSLC